MHPIFRRVTVFGPGLLGGSALLAVKKRVSISNLAPVELAAWGRRQEPLDALLKQGAVDFASTNIAELMASGEGSSGSPHLIILATPIGFMPELASEIAKAITDHPAVITDVGSTKGKLCERLDAIVEKNPNLNFVGAHPMAGSEKTGLEFADPDLFEDASCIITPTDATDPEALGQVETFWKWLGANTSRIPPRVHDEIVARISHVPHIAAAAIALTGFGDNAESAASTKFCGGGFRDTTRVAGGAVEMWTEILLENQQSVTDSLRQLIHHLESVHTSLDSGDTGAVLKFLADAKEKRDTLA